MALSFVAAWTKESAEGLLGLAWLGLRRAGSLLGSAWDGVSEFFEKGVNWLQGEGFITNKEIAVKAALEEFHRMGIEEAKAAALQEYGIQKGKEILDSFYTDSREKTDAKIWALKQAGYDTESLEGEIAKKRQALEEKKILEAEEAARKSGNSKQQVDKASILGDVYTSIGKGLEWLIKSLSREKENTDTALKRDGIEGIKKGAREVKPEEIQDLTLALNQAKDGPLKKAIQELIDEGKIKGKVDAVKMAQQGCVYASLYVDLVLVGASVEDIKGFVERWYNAGAIKADGTTYQGTIAKAYGYEVKRITDYNEFAKLMSNGGGMQYGVMKFYNENYKHEHNVNLYKYNGGWYVSDVGRMANHRMSWKKVLGDEKFFRYYQYLVRK